MFIYIYIVIYFRLCKYIIRMIYLIDKNKFMYFIEIFKKLCFIVVILNYMGYVWDVIMLIYFFFCFYRFLLCKF